MTIKKIIDYVQYSPHNTNPAILRQMLEELIKGSQKPTQSSSSIFGKGVFGDIIFGE